MSSIPETPIETILSRLEKVKPAGYGKWMALCPAHDDRGASLSIGTGEDGRVLLKCFAGCANKEIVAKIGKTMADLFPKDDRPKSGKAKPSNGNGKHTGKAHTTEALARDAAHYSVVKSKPGAIIGGTWQYFDGAGKHVASVIRWNTPTGKVFRPVSLHADGWRVKDPPAPWPLYRLPDFLATKDNPSVVYIFACEGEKTADALAKLGLIATTSAHGAESAALTEWGPLAARQVVIVLLPDADAAGERYIADVRGILFKLNPMAKVKVVRLPELGKGEDAVEFIERRNIDGKDEDAIRQEIIELAKAVEDETPPAEEGPPDHPDNTHDEIDTIDLPAPAPWPTLRPEAHHGIIGEIVAKIAPESEADPVGLLVQLLVASGSAIGRGAHARVEGDKHFCNLFAITVGKSGHGRKGTSWGRVRELMEMSDPDWLKNCIASGMSSGEGLIYRVRDSKLGGNADGEPDIIDAGIVDKRLLAIETEFGQVLRNLKRESNTLSAIMRNAWDGVTLCTLTKSALKATNPHVSILAHVTEAELHRCFEKADLFNGFANRFLWILVKRSKLLPEGGRRLDLSALGQRLQEAIAGARRLEELDRADETRELWASIYPRLTEARPGLGGIVTSRAEAQVLRLAVLYAAVDCSPVIMPAHLRAALAVWDCCEESARIIFGSEEPLDRDTKRILEALQAAGKTGMTRTDIRNALGRNVESKKIVHSLGELRDFGRARFERQDTGGKKPAERWFAITPLRH